MINYTSPEYCAKLRDSGFLAVLPILAADADMTKANMYFLLLASTTKDLNVPLNGIDIARRTVTEPSEAAHWPHLLSWLLLTGRGVAPVETRVTLVLYHLTGRKDIRTVEEALTRAAQITQGE